MKIGLIVGKSIEEFSQLSKSLISKIEMLKIVLNWQPRVWYTDKRKEEGKGPI